MRGSHQRRIPEKNGRRTERMPELTNVSAHSVSLVGKLEGQSKPRRPFADHAERALESKPGTPERALVEVPSDQGDAVGHAARLREGWQRLVRGRCPVRSRPPTP